LKKLQPSSEILLSQVSNPESFGVAELDSRPGVRLEEKPGTPRVIWPLVGVYIFDRRIFEAVKP